MHHEHQSDSTCLFAGLNLESALSPKAIWHELPAQPASARVLPTRAQPLPTDAHKLSEQRRSCTPTGGAKHGLVKYSAGMQKSAQKTSSPGLVIWSSHRQHNPQTSARVSLTPDDSPPKKMANPVAQQSKPKGQLLTAEPPSGFTTDIADTSPKIQVNSQLLVGEVNPKGVILLSATLCTTECCSQHCCRASSCPCASICWCS